ncbi:MAG: alpha/beta hydrolase [Gemmatimonadaceae bacterium]
MIAPEAFFFGRADDALFGLHYAPERTPHREAGVLLSYPMGHEYIVVHRAYRQLSMRLAEQGFHVMRFDYHACGNSSGQCEEGTPDRWTRDIATAIGELRARARCRKITLIGCRLGATLCAMLGAERGDIEHMVLWDPVVNGAAHIAEISDRHDDMLRRTQVAAGATSGTATVRELLGFAVSEAALRQIETIDLLAISEAPAKHVLLVESRTPETTATLRERLDALGSACEMQRFPQPSAWSWIEDPGTVLVPSQLVGSIARWVSEAHQ